VATWSAYRTGPRPRSAGTRAGAAPAEVGDGLDRDLAPGDARQETGRRGQRRRAERGAPREHGAVGVHDLHQLVEPLQRGRPRGRPGVVEVDAQLVAARRQSRAAAARARQGRAAAASAAT
jgi:hypothetical protein